MLRRPKLKQTPEQIEARLKTVQQTFEAVGASFDATSKQIPSPFREGTQLLQARQEYVYLVGQWGAIRKRSASEIEAFLRAHLPPSALEPLGPALSGDSEAAHRLLLAVDNPFRGLIPVLFYLSDQFGDGYRDMLVSAWNHNHRELIQASHNRRCLQAMFRKAAFPLPEELPEVVTLWRGTSHLPKRIAQRGLSWTTDRDIACWFALRSLEYFRVPASTRGAPVQFDGYPLVLKATVPRKKVLLYTQSRSQSEAVCFNVEKAEIDGDRQDWTKAMHRRSETAQALMDTLRGH